MAALIVAVFAVFHGHAHGSELPPGQSGLTYSIGFVIATGCCMPWASRWGWCIAGLPAASLCGWPGASSRRQA